MVLLTEDSILQNSAFVNQGGEKHTSVARDIVVALTPTPLERSTNVIILFVFISEELLVSAGSRWVNWAG